MIKEASKPATADMMNFEVATCGHPSHCTCYMTSINLLVSPNYESCEFQGAKIHIRSAKSAVWLSGHLVFMLNVTISHRIHGAAIYGNMDPINMPPMLAYTPYMDPMGMYKGVSLKVDKTFIRSDHDGGDHDDDTDHGEVLSLSS